MSPSETSRRIAISTAFNRSGKVEAGLRKQRIGPARGAMCWRKEQGRPGDELRRQTARKACLGIVLPAGSAVRPSFLAAYHGLPPSQSHLKSPKSSCRRRKQPNRNCPKSTQADQDERFVRASDQCPGQCDRQCHRRRQPHPQAGTTRIRPAIARVRKRLRRDERQRKQYAPTGPACSLPPDGHRSRPAPPGSRP